MEIFSQTLRQELYAQMDDLAEWAVTHMPREGVYQPPQQSVSTSRKYIGSGEDLDLTLLEQQNGRYI